MRILLLCGAAAALAACGGTASPAPGGPVPTPTPRPQVTLGQQFVPDGGPGGASTPAGGGGGGGASAPGPGGSGGGGSAPGPGGGAHSGAAPGSYPISYTSRRSGGPPSTPSSGQGTLTVGAPTASAAGTAQRATLQAGSGGTITEDTLFPKAGGLSLTHLSSGGGSSPCPPFELAPIQPLEVVPAQLMAGAGWGPVPFSSGPFSGSSAGRVEGQRTDRVGGTAVSVFVVDLTITVDHGSYCGFTFSGSISQTADWAPSLQLLVQGTSTSDFKTDTLFGEITAVTTFALQAIRPS